MWIIVLCQLFIIIIFYYYYDTRKPHGYPPGPSWYPVVGNLFQFLSVRKNSSVHGVWQEWADTYGPLLGVRLGSDYIVVVSDYELAKDIMSRDEFEGRPDGFLMRLRTNGKRLGIVFTDGSFGLEQRKFCLKQLKEFGFGRTSMEQKITDEINEFVQFLNAKCQEGPIELYKAINVHVMNSLWSMIAGQRFSHNDAKLTALLDCIHDSFCMQDMTGGILNQMPILRLIGPIRKMYKANLKITKKLVGFLKETVDTHKRTICCDHTRDLIDAYLDKIERSKENDVNFTEEQLMILLMDLFMAGADTTTNTISFLVLMLMKYPDIQNKVQQELDSFYGKDLQPTLQDRSKLHYLEAVIMEVQRFCNIAPTTIPHRVKDDVSLKGYKIPKDTTVLVSLYNIHMDKNYWKDPELFCPERFLNSNGEIKSNERLVPFGFGRRRCLGETLARASIFKYTATLLLRFNISAPAGTEVNTRPIDGAILFPAPFSAVLTPRTQ